MLNTMVSFIILLIARTARIACADRHTDRQTYKTTTVTLDAHAHRGLTTESVQMNFSGNDVHVYLLVTLRVRHSFILLTLGAHARSDGYIPVVVLCVCMCVCVYVCMYV